MSLREEIAAVEHEALTRAEAAPDAGALEQLRIDVLGKKGSLTRVLRGLGAVPAEERPAYGALVNQTKERVAAALGARGDTLAESARAARLSGSQLDVTLPGYGQSRGHEHPLARTMIDVCEILQGLGFAIADGPDIEDDYHNFEALNIPADHPARDMQDTFFVEGGNVLRTHTSPVQIRVMETTPPPLCIIAPGSVYRIDDDVTHSPMFHQVEGLMVDRGITFPHLKGVLTEFLRRLYGSDLRVRFRPSYFPFTEPSAEVDIGCVICKGEGVLAGAPCRICKTSGWLEILGAGMVDPAVFAHVGYDPEVYSGFAFGLGIERIAMLRYCIDDIRLLYGSDLRFLSQF
ncbi:MAG: phenylalanyl-tRNA synthetase alpha chain [Hyphomicrobiaceae bacterium]